MTAAAGCRFARFALAGEARPHRVLSSSAVRPTKIGARPPGRKDQRKTLPAIRAQLDEAAFAEAWEQGRALSPDEAIALALSELR